MPAFNETAGSPFRVMTSNAIALDNHFLEAMRPNKPTARREAPRTRSDVAECLEITQLKGEQRMKINQR